MPCSGKRVTFDSCRGDGLFEQPAADSPFCGSSGMGNVSLAADDEKVPRSNRWAGEAILRLQGLERNAKPLGYFGERVA